MKHIHIEPPTLEQVEDWRKETERDCIVKRYIQHVAHRNKLVLFFGAWYVPCWYKNVFVLYIITMLMSCVSFPIIHGDWLNAAQLLWMFATVAISYIVMTVLVPMTIGISRGALQSQVSKVIDALVALPRN